MAQTYPTQIAPTDGYPLDMFVNLDLALQYQCQICNKVCRNPVQLNCNEGHAFCNDCISGEPHTVITTEPIYYDASNNSNELTVNEDYTKQTQIQVSTTNTMCPICRVSRCSKLPCPLIADNIGLLLVHCTNGPYGCQWQGTLAQLTPHLQSNCINANCKCPFHVFGCGTNNLPQTELITHFQTAQMEHLQLQINAIQTLQVGYQQMQAQIHTVNQQQVQLTTLITQYEHKLNEISQQQQRIVPPKDSKSQQNLQFNINMNHNKKEEVEDYHRWKNNPILNMMSSIQKQIISQNAIATQRKIERIASRYNLSELSELFTNMNKKTDYAPTFHKKLLIIRGSTTKNSEHHGVMAVDLHNKRKYPLLYDDPITKYASWDIEFSALTVMHNVDCTAFQNAIHHPKESMLFALKHGLDYEHKQDHKTISHMTHRDEYLDSKYTEHALVDISQETSQHCSVFLRCGGSMVNTQKDGETTKSVNGLVLNTGDWISCLPNLNTARYGASATYSAHNGVIVSGGKDDYKTLNSVEAWNVSKGDTGWKCLPSMNEKRYSPCCTCYAPQKMNDEYLFVGGGWNQKDKVLKSCEIYNFTNKYWTPIAPMSVSRYGAGCCVWRNVRGCSVVVAGGANKQAVKSVEQYDVHKNKWYSLADTNAKHRNSPSVWICKEYGKFLSPFNGMLCVAGDIWCKGEQQQIHGTVNGCIEMYDAREWRQQWLIVEDLRNILIDNKSAQIRGMIPFS